MTEPVVIRGRPTGVTAIRLLVAALLAAVGLVALTPVASFACSCVGGTDAQYERWADTVFTGTLTDVDPPSARDDGLLASTDPNTLRFTVHDVDKGETPLVTEVQSAFSSASCGLEGMQVGATYVVYATHSRGELWTGLCSGTHRTAAAAAAGSAYDHVVAALWAMVQDFLGLAPGS